jgi:transketolase
VEHLAALRAIPNVHVHRPADAIETAECWRTALERRDGPAVIALTRQGLPALRTSHTDDNLTARGAYVLIDASGPRQATILATGSEVALAVEARGTLEAEGIATAVVSMPCQELFDSQPASYRAETLGAAPRVAVEAATPMGWTRYIASEDDFVGMTGFGASAPAGDLYDHFGITSQAVVERVRRLI